MANDQIGELEGILGKQRAAHNQMRPEPMALRKDRIERAMRLLKEHSEDLCKVMSADFGNRSPSQSMLTDIVGTINFGKYCLKKMEHWAKDCPTRRELRGLPAPAPRTRGVTSAEITEK